MSRLQLDAHDVVHWNCVSRFCINSHIPLLVALLLAHRKKAYSPSSWKAAHAELMYALSYGCDIVPLSNGAAYNKDEDEDGKEEWGAGRLVP